VKRLTFHFEIAFGSDEAAEVERESQLDACIERAHPDDRSSRAELDARPFGFGPAGGAR
jgi:hypothetical protein